MCAETGTGRTRDLRAGGEGTLMGFGIRIAPGLRLSASPRGLRVGIGPRMARVHVGSGRPSVSTGAGGVTLWTTGPRSRRRTTQRRSRTYAAGAPTRTSLVALERQARADARTQHVTTVADLERHLTSFHLQPFPPAAYAEPDPPVPVDPALLSGQLQAEAIAAIPWWQVGRRRDARQAASWRAPGLAAERNNSAEAAYIAAVQKAREHWSLLVANDPTIVLGALEDAFEDNESPAVAVDCTGDQVSIVIVFPDLELIPAQRATTTPGGKPTLKPRTKTDRNQVYVTALGSTVLATVKEALAVAPSINETAVVVVRRIPNGEPDIIYHGRFHRNLISSWPWDRINPADELLSAQDAELQRTGATAEVQALDHSTNPALTALLDEVRPLLSDRSTDGT